MRFFPLCKRKHGEFDSLEKWHFPVQFWGLYLWCWEAQVSVGHGTTCWMAATSCHRPCGSWVPCHPSTHPTPRLLHLGGFLVAPLGGVEGPFSACSVQDCFQCCCLPGLVTWQERLSGYVKLYTETSLPSSTVWAGAALWDFAGNALVFLSWITIISFCYKNTSIIAKVEIQGLKSSLTWP